MSARYSGRFQKMLKNAYLLAKIGADTAESEQHFAEILPIGRRVAGGRGGTPARSRCHLLLGRICGWSPRGCSLSLKYGSLIAECQPEELRTFATQV